METNKYRVSELLNRVDCGNGIIAIFHPLEMDVLFLQKQGDLEMDLFQLCQDDEKLFHECIHRHYLVPENMDVKAENRQLAQALNAGEIAFSVFKMVITTKCNLDCKYCLIEKNLDDRRQEKEHLSAAKAEELLAFFWKACQKTAPTKRTLLLYGGEPLCNAAVLQLIIAKAREAEAQGLTNGSLEIVLETNGTLVTEEIAGFFRENDVFSIVSIDGLPEIHNYYRVKHDHSESWQEAVRGYQILQQTGVKTVISCVFSTQFAERCEEAILYVAEELKPASIGLNLYHVIEQNRIEDDQTLDFISRYIDSWEVARQKGLYIEHIMRRIRPLVQKRVRVIDCHACGHRFVSDESGRIGICEGFLGRDDYFKPRATVEELYTDPGFLAWSTRTPLTMEACHGCIAQGVCGGGCAYNGLVMGEGLYSPDPYICEASRQLVQWAITKWGAIPEVQNRVKQTAWTWLEDNEREVILGNVPLHPFVPLQSMSKMSEVSTCEE